MLNPSTTEVLCQSPDREENRMITHKFSCDLCELSYKTKDSLKKHKRWKHSGQTYSCGECRDDFSFPPSQFVPHIYSNLI